MRLFQAELYKLYSSKFVRWMLAIVLILNLSSLYYVCQETGIPTKDFVNLMILYRDDPEFIENEYTRLDGAINDYVAALEAGDETASFVPEFNYVSDRRYMDWSLLAQFFEKRDEADRYEERILSYIEQAENNKNRLLILGGDAAYSYRYQDRIIEVYQGLLSRIEIEFDYIHGWDVLFSYKGDMLLIFVAVLFLASMAVPLENTSGMDVLISISPRGRAHTALAKIAATALLSVTAAILVRLESFAAIGLLRGYSNPWSPVQLIGRLELCPYALNHIQLFFLSLLLLAATVVVIVGLTLLVSSVSRSPLLSALATGLFLIMNFSVSKLNTASSLKYLNVFSIASVQDIFGRYRAVPIGNHVLGLFGLVFAVYAAVSLAALVGILLLFPKNRKNQALLKARRKIQSRITDIFAESSDDSGEILTNRRGIQRIASYHGIGAWEILKQQRPLFLILLLIAVKALYCIMVPYPQSYDDEIYYAYMTQLAGPLDTDKQSYIESELQSVNGTIAAYDSQMHAYVDGDISEEAFQSYLSEYQKAMASSGVIARVRDHAGYLMDLKAEHQLEGYFLYDTGIIGYVCRDFDVLLYFCILILCGQMFYDEYCMKTSSHSFALILRTTKKGRNVVLRAKLGLGMLVSAILFIATEAMSYLYVFSLHGAADLSAPLCSLEQFGGIFGNLSIRSYLILVLSVKAVAAVMLSYLGMVLSLLLKGGIWAYITTMVLTLLPRLLTRFHIDIFKYVDYCSFLSGDRLFRESGSLQANFPFFYAAAYIMTLSLAVVCIGKYAGNRYCK